MRFNFGRPFFQQKAKCNQHATTRQCFLCLPSTSFSRKLSHHPKLWLSQRGSRLTRPLAGNWEYDTPNVTGSCHSDFDRSILPSKHRQPERASSLQRTAARATSLRGGTAAARARPPLRRALGPLGNLRGVAAGCGPHQRPCPHGDHGCCCCCCSLDVAAQQQLLLRRCPSLVGCDAASLSNY